MRKCLFISILFCCHYMALAQPLASIERTETITDCSEFVDLVNQRKFQSAEAMLLSLPEEVCNTSDVMLAKAKLKAAAFEFEEAEEILLGLVDEFPENQEYLNEWNHMVGLLSKAGEFQPYYLKPINSGKSDNLMIAWMNDSTPQLLKNQGLEPIYYPIRQETKAVMQFDFEELKSRPDLQKITYRLQAKRYEEIGPGTYLPDSSLIISAIERLPYASRTNAERLNLVLFGSDLKFKGPPSFADCKCNNSYPAYRSVDSTLIFSSDREGGYGGMDLWQTKWANNEWSEPMNMGPAVNSDKNEVFSTLWGDTLFFSSNKLYSGFGGYDIFAYQFSTSQTWNLGLPINGPYDEHSMHVIEPGRAYMVSNRAESAGGKMFMAKWTVIEQFFSELTGEITKAGNLSGMQVHLLSDDGAILQKGVINSQGKFSFKHVKGQETYRVEIPNADLPLGSRLQLFDSSEKLILDITSSSKLGFLFELLEPKDYYLEKMIGEDESVLNVDIFGKVDKKEEGFKIVLLDSEGEIVATALTASDGKFKFESVKPDDRYRIRSDVKNASGPIHILDGNGGLLQTIHPDESGGYNYVRIKPEDGVITITNEHNKKVRISNKDLFDIGVVKYHLNSTEILAESAATLNQLASILKTNPDVSIHLSGHTDSQGSDTYNLELSERRIQSAMKYLASQGIRKERLSGTGFGESKLLNHCGDGVECTEEEHAVNRRTEFSLSETKN